MYALKIEKEGCDAMRCDVMPIWLLEVYLKGMDGDDGGEEGAGMMANQWSSGAVILE